ncbi:1-deoxy-D-xylulose-5-phosphate reductoisomerase [Erythrobacter rubeus]|uniref:1-deoxy-D-xylulose 5-phosphate reductoisomerase n=1 Tax=Erythrobacter rubeus TaxID=2760803 RepID=A0ABR8KVC3_9SPHN|nr:1-deoxy-D-xylulose-5-phosphate reductoisomerase [Erythrobacter rubeus]MBD2842186.1 1-deoxy-D-xylulose-5-phosphate reductoisomerase [Erythrobacter rubeus]
MTRSITILGATGSIGASTLDLVRSNPDKWRVGALTANCSADELARLARAFGARLAVVGDETCLGDLKAALAGTTIEAAGGSGALRDAARIPVDMTVAAIVGCAGLAPVMAAAERGGTIALANKEALVSAGEILKSAVERSGATLLPTDSEHNAIFQCLSGNSIADVRRIILTASGGPFRTLDADQLKTVTREQALKHPNWEMGAKITIDSATMMNKGLEFIEAHHLFPVGLDKIEIVVHPQSIVHSMVEYRDRSTLAQLGPSDMRVPIASCLAWPERMQTELKPLNLAEIGQLTFEPTNETLFPATRICREAIDAGGAAPAILNAANEIAVAAFLDGQIGFMDITAVVESTLSKYTADAPGTLDDVLHVDAQARSYAKEALESHALV